ncbi:MAG: class I SAM-dependent methyltransferase [Candidatus Thorarchaeota archaeon]|nr:class I SAM-dependent methyltransferase [Candidatus Thorarchaeota archaeon]
MNKFFDANKDVWDDKVDVHKDSEFYNVKGFMKGESTLDPIELEELGDVSGKSLLHLQCHFGLDTMCWERLGADVVGVDFSGEAIDLARSIAKEANLNAKFVQANIYDLREHLDQKFDVVFTSGGVIMWLNDLEKWGEIIDHFLKPGGVFYIREFHSFQAIFDDETEEPILKVRYPYFHGSEPMTYVSDTTYTDSKKKMDAKRAYEWNHSISRIINSLTRVGLRIEFFNEFPFTTYKALTFLEENDEGRWVLPEGKEFVPFMFSLKATKR